MASRKAGMFWGIAISVVVLIVLALPHIKQAL
jgi:hypothetical protein